MDLEQVKERYSHGEAKQIYGRGDGGPVRSKFCNYIIDNFSDCKSFFEFGCSAGFNLQRIKHKLPDAKYEGIDINMDAVLVGQASNINVNIGDESTLTTLLDDEFDVVFTASVLNHMPDYDFPMIMRELQRIAKKHIVCMEGNVSLEPDYFIHDWPKYGFENVEHVGKGDWVEYHLWRWDEDSTHL